MIAIKALGEVAGRTDDAGKILTVLEIFSRTSLELTQHLTDKIGSSLGVNSATNHVVYDSDTEEESLGDKGQKVASEIFDQIKKGEYKHTGANLRVRQKINTYLDKIIDNLPKITKEIPSIKQGNEPDEMIPSKIYHLSHGMNLTPQETISVCLTAAALTTATTSKVADFFQKKFPNSAKSRSKIKASERAWNCNRKVHAVKPF
jgi:hypothetical protein